ncbi:MAG: tetratricopeptide repeat protein [Verrucomicrobiota bacterium]
MRHLLLSFIVLWVVACKTVEDHSAGVSPATPDISQELESTIESANAGDPRAQNLLAINYLYGADGLDEDPQSAYYWFNRSAELGNPYAMSNLGRLYRDGTGVGQDVSRAKAWFLRAADAGHYQAMSSLGELFAVGEGVPRDLKQASVWYSRSVLGPFDPFIANNAAWFFSTVEDEDLLKPELAINLMLQVVSMRERYYELDTLAAAYAASGDFDNAIYTQQRALVLGYEGEADEIELGDFEDRLGVYFDRQRYIFFEN